MTLSPTAHALALARARVRLSRQGIDFDGLVSANNSKNGIARCRAN